MSLSGRGGLPRMDEAVKGVLAAYGRASRDRRAEVIRRSVPRLTDAQRVQLTARLAEVSLGQLWVLLHREQG